MKRLFILRSQFIQISFVLVLPFLIPLSASARCTESLASSQIENMVAGGASIERAFQAASRSGHIDSEDCVIEVRGYIRRYGTNYPYAYKALF
jgi:hypothetical protein